MSDLSLLEAVTAHERELGCWTDREFCGKHHLQFVPVPGTDPIYWRCPTAVRAALPEEVVVFEQRRSEGRVSQGVALLTRRLGRGWWNRVDAEKIDMSRADRCVLGQLFGSYGLAVHGRMVMTHSEAVAHGFTEGGGSAGFATLTPIWRGRIRALQRRPS